MSEDKDRLVQPNHTRMKESSFVRNWWVVTVEEGTDKKDMLKSDFWAHLAEQFSPYDRIEVRSDDDAFFAEYIVLSCDRTYAKVKELSWFSLTSDETQQDEEIFQEYAHKWRGPQLKHCVIRKSDSACVAEGFVNKDAAFKWIAEKKRAA